MTPEQHTLERYLSAATRGLWGRRRREVREELECHLLERSRIFLNRGESPDYAVSRACEGMGSPDRVALQLMRVHTHFGRGALVSLLLVCGLSTYADQLAPPAVPWGPPGQQCELLSMPSARADLQICQPFFAVNTSVESLRRRLGSQDIPNRVVQRRSSNGSLFPVLEVNLPGSPALRLMIGSATPGGSVSTLELVEGWRIMDSTAKLRGWHDLRLLAKHHQLSWGDQNAAWNAYNLYASQAVQQIRQGLLTSISQITYLRLARQHTLEEGAPGLQLHRLPSALPEGSVQAVLFGFGDGQVFLDVQPVRDGQIQVFVPPHVLGVRTLPEIMSGWGKTAFLFEVR